MSAHMPHRATAAHTHATAEPAPMPQALSLASSLSSSPSASHASPASSTPAVVRPGSGSITWTINGERLMVAGWSRAILLQIAHPLIAAGVARHSGFRADAGAPLVRLRRTIKAMLGLTFGSEADAAAVAARIHAIHDRINGPLSGGTRTFPDGTAYSAHDPHLQAWVHMTLLDSVVRTYELLVRPLTPAERDACCAEARAAAFWLRVPADALPATWAEMQQLIDARFASGEIDVTAEARTLAHAILWPHGARWRGPIGLVHRLMTIGLLPPSLRAAFGLSWGPRDERRLQWLARVLRTVRRIAPAFLARWRSARVAERRS